LHRPPLPGHDHSCSKIFHLSHRRVLRQSAHDLVVQRRGCDSTGQRSRRVYIDRDLIRTHDAILTRLTPLAGVVRIDGMVSSNYLLPTTKEFQYSSRVISVPMREYDLIHSLQVDPERIQVPPQGGPIWSRIEHRLVRLAPHIRFLTRSKREGASHFGDVLDWRIMDEESSR